MSSKGYKQNHKNLLHHQDDFHLKIVDFKFGLFLKGAFAWYFKFSQACFENVQNHSFTRTNQPSKPVNSCLFPRLQDVLLCQRLTCQLLVHSLRRNNSNVNYNLLPSNFKLSKAKSSRCTSSNIKLNTSLLFFFCTACHIF